jgi:phage gp37-like protein
MIGELEDAIVARIKQGQAAGLWPYRIATIDSYGGQIDEDTQSTFQFPAVFVSYTGHQTKRKTGERGRIIEVHLALYVAAHNPRNERATRQGDMHEPGSYQIVEDMLNLLENQRLGMPMTQPLEHQDVKTLFVARTSDGHRAESILAVRFACEFGWFAGLPECANVTKDDWLKTGQTFYLTPGDDAADLSAVIQHTTP